MPGRAKACVESLSEDEQASLKKLCCAIGDRAIPGDHAVTLMKLGLAELNCGDIGPTGPGRTAITQKAAG